MKYINKFYSKPLVLLVLISLCISTISAQDNNTNFWNNVRYGGGIGISIGNGFFTGTLAPSAIYEFNPQFALGVGLNGTYSNADDFSSTVLGGSLISLFNPIPEVQLSAEFEQLNVNQNFDNSIFEDDNFWFSSLYIGAGYRYGNVAIGIRYDVLFDEDRGIFADPWAPFVRVYF